VKEDRVYLVHILECIARIELYTVGGRDLFITDIKTQDAVLRNLQTLAESVRRLSAPMKEARSEVDWRSIEAFRNVAVHDYLGIDLNQIWDIVEADIPDLKRTIERTLRTLEGDE
jgi:uncharacterized protein with HEPN domain